MIDIRKLKEGVTVRTADLRKRTVKRTDGKYVYFADGSQYGFRHPDLIEIVEETPAEAVSESEEEPAPKAKKSSRKAKKSE